MDMMRGQTRTFISVELPHPDDFKSITDTLKGIPGVRITPLNQLHITLSFLGDVDTDRIPKICSELKLAFKDVGSFHLSVKGLGAFPNERHARIIWMGIEDGDVLASCAKIVERTLKRIGIRYDRKEFTPHITIARAKDAVNISRIIDDHRDDEFLSFDCSSINVMKSILKPTGAEHSVICTIPLKQNV